MTTLPLCNKKLLWLSAVVKLFISSYQNFHPKHFPELSIAKTTLQHPYSCSFLLSCSGVRSSQCTQGLAVMPRGVWGQEAVVPHRDFPWWRRRRRLGRGQWAEERWPREKAFVPLSRTESSPQEWCSEMEPTREGEGKGVARDGAAEDGCSGAGAVLALYGTEYLHGWQCPYRGFSQSLPIPTVHLPQKLQSIQHHPGSTLCKGRKPICMHNTKARTAPENG